MQTRRWNEMDPVRLFALEDCVEASIRDSGSVHTGNEKTLQVYDLVIGLSWLDVYVCTEPR